jgi:hypothetical protein
MADNKPGDDPKLYLQTEARIIIENDRYAVLALRIDKSAIARNLPFLAALAQLVPAPVQAPERDLNLS